MVRRGRHFFCLADHGWHSIIGESEHRFAPGESRTHLLRLGGK